MGNFMPGPVANMGGYTEPRYVVIRSPRGNFMPHKTGASPVEYYNDFDDGRQNISTVCQKLPRYRCLIVVF